MPSRYLPWIFNATDVSKVDGSRLDIDFPLELSRLFVNSSVAAEVT